MADATPKPRRGNNPSSNKGRQPKGGRGGDRHAPPSGLSSRAAAVAPAAPTIHRPPHVSTTIFTPDMPRQQLLFASSTAPQKLYEPSSSPASPLAPMFPRPHATSMNRGKASPTVPSFDTTPSSRTTGTTSLYLAPDAHEATASSLRRWKLVSPQLQFCAPDAVPGPWSDMTQFHAIACVGLEGVGKSTILSMLCGHDRRNAAPTNTPWFPIQSNDSVLHSTHETNGIDMCITRDHVVFLDCQPLLSTSMMAELAQHHETPKYGALALDQQIQLTSLHLLVYLLSVCHYVVVVYDRLDDPDLWQLIQLAQLIKARYDAAGDATTITPTYSNPTSKFIFVANKMAPLTPSQLERHRQHLGHVIGIPTCHDDNDHTSAAAHADGDDVDAVPIFCLPPFSATVSDAHAAEALRAHVALLTARLPAAASTEPVMTFQDWLAHGSRLFESIRKATPMVDYARLLQNIASSKG